MQMFILEGEGVPIESSREWSVCEIERLNSLHENELTSNTFFNILITLFRYFVLVLS